jgi:hypothetical protein
VELESLMVNFFSFSFRRERERERSFIYFFSLRREIDLFFSFLV